MKNELGIYIHVPFCVRKCAYCDFYSITDRSFEKEFTGALCKHIEIRSKDLAIYTVNTVFFGGGTPSLLSGNSFGKIMRSLKEHFRFSDKVEISVEANPATLSESLLETYLENGVNRISVGFQSANDNELKLLSRIHNRDDFVSTYQMIRSSGIKNVNVDLMYGIPDQDMNSLADSLETVIDLSPAHISVYGLKIEPQTLFGMHPDQYSFPDEDAQCEMYKYISETLRTSGYHRYEFSNFSKPRSECKHNLKYWQRDPYIGFGPAASSFIDNKRYTYKRDLGSYIDSVNKNVEPECSESVVLNDEDVLNEIIMLGLRLEKGVIPGVPLLLDAKKYINRGLMQFDGERLRFTDDGILVSNYILSDLLI